MMAALVALVILGVGGTVLAITYRPAPATTAGAGLTAPGCVTASSAGPRLTGIRPQFVTLTGMPFAVAVTGDGHWSFVSTGVGRSIEVLRAGAGLAPVLAGRVTADALRNLLVVGLMTGTGALVGFRFHAGPAAAAAAIGLAVTAGLAFSWLNLLLGLVVRDPESAGLAGLFPVIILFFTSSALVPVATMPGWLQAFAKANPVTVITTALRALTLGGPTSRPVTEAAAWIAALLAVTVPAAVTRYRRAAST